MECFRIKTGVWKQSLGYEARDVDGNPWFKIEGRDVAVSKSKKLILNTGIHHATMDRTKEGLWHIHVAGERRATVGKNLTTRQYDIYIHDYPYPPKDAHVDLASLRARLEVVGNPRDHEYWLFSLFALAYSSACF